MKRIGIFSFFTALLFISNVAFASEVDVLLQKLVEKGILSASEAQEIRTETNEEIAKTDKQKIEDYKQLAKDSLPDWVKNTKLKGDLRLRYAYNHPDANNGLTNDTQRGRIRLRMGFETQINDKVTVAAGLATGLASPNDNPYNATVGNLTRDYARSANQTFTGAFSKKPIDLDYAYATYAPTKWFSFSGGKLINPFWDPEGKFVWDDNIRPEGAMTIFSKSWDSHLDTFLNAGYLMLDQNSNDHDAPMLYAFQPGLKYTFNDQFALKGAFSYYNWANVKGHFLQGGSYDSSLHNAYGNTRDANGNLVYGYNSLIPQVEFSVNHPLSMLNLDSMGLGFLDVPYFSLFGEYLKNTEIPDDKNSSGYVAGFKFGSPSINKWADWQFQYDFRRLERDAIPDILPDADFYNSIAGGTTGVTGSRFVLQYGLSKNNWLAFNVFRDEKIDSPRLPETTFYADWNLKW